MSESRDISRLLEPKLIALDSSHLGAIAADRAATDRARRQRAEVFERAVVDSGSVIVLSTTLADFSD